MSINVSDKKEQRKFGIVMAAAIACAATMASAAVTSAGVTAPGHVAGWVKNAVKSGVAPDNRAVTIAVHLAFGQYVEARGSGRRVPTVSVLLTVAGIALVAGAANFRAFWVHDLFHLAGVVVWLAGMPAIIVSMRQEARLAQAQWRPAGKPTQEG